LALAAPALGIPEIATVHRLLTLVAMRRGQPMGPTSDTEIEEFIYDALEYLPASNEVEVRVDGGRATITGSVPHKRLKRDIGEIAWAIPAINDVQNNVTISPETPARRARR
jgi:osmotically-inducible protein OsmY